MTRRRRLLLFSAPAAVVVILVLVKLWSVVIAGGAVASDYAGRDAEALRGHVDVLTTFDVVEPAKSHFAAGDLAVLDGRLERAGEQFSAALAQTDPAASCPVRVNLELVGETLGDRAAAAFEGDAAVAWYRGALQAVEQAPKGCFAGSTDPDEQRRVLLDGAAARLTAKIDAAQVAPPPSPPPAAAAPPPPPPPPPPAGAAAAPTAPDQQRRLNPGSGDPLDRLRQILRDAAAAGGR